MTTRSAEFVDEVRQLIDFSGAATSAQDQPDVAVVILTQGDRPVELGHAVASVRQQRNVTVDVVLVVNGGCRPAQDSFDQMVVLEENAGIPGGRNIGAAATGAPLVMFLDDDAMLLDPDSLAIAVDRFEADPGLGAMAIRLIDENGDTQRRHVPRLGGGTAGRAGEVTYFVGAAFVVRAAAFGAVGGFDADFFYAMEESDLSWRLLDAGWSIWYSADLAVFHPLTAPSRHADHVRLTARNRLWAAWRSLPGPVAAGYLVTWTLVAGLRRAPLREVFTGYRQAWAARPVRRPMRWRTVGRMTRLGRPPIV